MSFTGQYFGHFLCPVSKQNLQNLEKHHWFHQHYTGKVSVLLVIFVKKPKLRKTAYLVRIWVLAKKHFFDKKKNETMAKIKKFHKMIFNFERQGKILHFFYKISNFHAQILTRFCKIPPLKSHFDKLK